MLIVLFYTRSLLSLEKISATREELTVSGQLLVIEQRMLLSQISMHSYLFDNQLEQVILISIRIYMHILEILMESVFLVKT